MNANTGAESRRYDVAVIGGGINGCGIARDAAGRGLSVLLLEQGDLASATSSASSKLIHGGIRYLEHYEFSLVRESLKERDVVLGIAPHIARPMRFVFPHNPTMRPMWMIRAGLFLYDHLGGRKFPPSRRIGDFATGVAGKYLKADFDRAFEYSDCWIDDARLVVLTARDAARRGARVLTRTRCVRAHSSDGVWRLETTDAQSGATGVFAARVLVNATGPWVSEFLSDVVAAESAVRDSTTTRKVKGSHLIVRKWFDHDRAYILQNRDQRIVFVLPFEDDYALIGTTDVDYEGDPGAVEPTAEERRYLLQCIRDYFTYEIGESEIVGGFAGVRPLYDDGVAKAQEITRDYVLKYAATPDGAGLLNVFGGKLTTYRKLAETAMAKIARDFGNVPGAWTARRPLPGGEFDPERYHDMLRGCRQRFPFVPADVMARWFRSYGLEIDAMLCGVNDVGGLGVHFGAGLYEVEVRWLVTREWAQTVDDILWRRSKLGLKSSDIELSALAAWVHDYRRRWIEPGAGSGLGTDDH